MCAYGTPLVTKIYSMNPTLQFFNPMLKLLNLTLKYLNPMLKFLNLTLKFLKPTLNFMPVSEYTSHEISYRLCVQSQILYTGGNIYSSMDKM